MQMFGKPVATRAIEAWEDTRRQGRAHVDQLVVLYNRPTELLSYAPMDISLGDGLEHRVVCLS